MTEILGKNILVVTAHPDDESYAAGGTIWENHRRGGKTFLICATLGERGTSHLKRPLSERALKDLRRKELKRAAKFLKISKLFIYDFPDGKVQNHKLALLKKCRASARKCSPEIIMSFGNDGLTAHRDHIASGAVAKKVAKELGAPFVAFGLPPRLAKRAKEWLHSRRKNLHYEEEISFIKPNVRVRINTRKKCSAIECHTSQMDGKNAYTGFPDYAVRELTRYEHFKT